MIGALAAGAATFATSGLWRHSPVRFDGLTWLGKGDGQITGVDPQTGEPKGQLRLGEAGDVMTVTQGEDVLVVTNTRTGEVTAVSLPDLVARPIGSGDPDSFKVLLATDQIYVADLMAGAVQRIDALTAATIGQPWLGNGPLVDAVADQARRLWVLGRDGQLVALRWSQPGGTLAEERRATVEATGPGAVLAAHDSGVTVVDPVRQVAVRVGTGNGQTITTSLRSTQLLAADISPAGLALFSAPDVSTVLMVGDDGAVAVDSARLGCRRPGRPVAYRGKVYASCRGAGKVIVLDRSGQPNGEVATPGGGDADLVLAGGRLILNVPGEPAAVMVEPDGSARTIRTEDPDVPARDARPRPPAGSGTDNRARGRPGAPARPGAPNAPGATTPTRGADGAPPPDAAAPPSADAPAPATDGPATTEAAPPPAASPAAPPPPPPDYRPTNVSATALSTGSVRVSWSSGGGTITGYRILHAGTGAVVASPVTTATSAVISGLTLGQPVSFHVEAITTAGTFRSAVSNTVYPYREPPARERPTCPGCKIP